MGLGTTTALLAAGTIGSSLIGGISANKRAKAQQQAANDANATQRYIYDDSVERTEPWRLTGINALAEMSGLLGLPAVPGAGAPGVVKSTIQEQRQMDLPTYMAPRFETVSRNVFNVGKKQFDTRPDAEKYAASLAPAQTAANPTEILRNTPGYQFARDEGLNAIERISSARGNRLGSNTLREAQRFGTGLADQTYGSHYNRLAGLANVGQTATSQQIGLGQNYANAFGQNARAAGQARASGYAGWNNAIQNGINGGFNILGMRQAGFI